MADTTHVSVVQTGDMTEIQWGDGEPAPENTGGYVQLIDGDLYVPFRSKDDTPYVFVLDLSGARIEIAEDVPPPGVEVVWKAGR